MADDDRYTECRLGPGPRTLIDVSEGAHKGSAHKGLRQTRPVAVPSGTGQGDQCYQTHSAVKPRANSGPNNPDNDAA